jgi:cytochrome P450
VSARIKTTAGFGPSIPDEGRENLLPYGDTAFNAFGPDNALRAKGAPRVAELSGWVAGQCARDVLADDGFGAAIWAASDRGDITPAQAPLVVRSLLTAGVDTTVHGIGALLACLARTPAAARGPDVGAARIRRGDAPGVAGADVLPHRGT